MPRFRFSNAPDSQIDPFNAGDPIMPGDEPEWLDEEPADVEEPAYAPHGEESGEPHKVSDNYQAPTTRDHGYDAPSIEEAPTPTAGPRTPSLGQQWQRATEGARRAQGRIRKRTTPGCVVALVVAVTLFGVVGDLLVGCVSLVTETVADGVDAVFFDNGVTFDDYVSDGSGSWRDTADELDLAAGGTSGSLPTSTRSCCAGRATRQPNSESTPTPGRHGRSRTSRARSAAYMPTTTARGPPIST